MSTAPKSARRTSSVTSSSKRRPRTALVTGAVRGIGFETCRQLGAIGYRVIVSGRSAAHAGRAAEQLTAQGISATPVELDVSDPASVRRARQYLSDRGERIDALVNNAAILEAENSDWTEIDRETFRATFDTNVLGAIEVCRAFVPGMVARRFGRVVNVSSGAGQLASMSTYAPAYSMSKTALNAFTRILAASTRGTGVLVNAVDPGWVRTDMGGPGAPRSVQQGADTIAWLATLPDDGPSGGFFHDRRPIAW